MMNDKKKIFKIKDPKSNVSVETPDFKEAYDGAKKGKNQLIGSKGQLLKDFSQKGADPLEPEQFPRGNYARLNDKEFGMFYRLLEHRINYPNSIDKATWKELKKEYKAARDELGRRERLRARKLFGLAD